LTVRTPRDSRDVVHIRCGCRDDKDVDKRARPAPEAARKSLVKSSPPARNVVQRPLDPRTPLCRALAGGAERSETHHRHARTRDEAFGHHIDLDTETGLIEAPAAHHAQSRPDIRLVVVARDRRWTRVRDRLEAQASPRVAAAAHDAPVAA